MSDSKTGSTSDTAPTRRIWNPTMTTPTTPLMTIRLTWTASTPHYARTMLRELENQLRGAKLSALRPAGWDVSYRTFQGTSEARQNPSSATYGVALWVHPAE